MSAMESLWLSGGLQGLLILPLFSFFPLDQSFLFASFLLKHSFLFTYLLFFWSTVFLSAVNGSVLEEQTQRLMTLETFDQSVFLKVSKMHF